MTILLLLMCGGLLFVRRWLAQTFIRLVLVLGGSQSTAIWAYAVATLPGVLLHEVAHFLTAALLGLRTGKIEMLPRLLSDGGVEMGSVQVEQKDPFRLSLVGLAPLLFGLPMVIWLSHLVVPAEAWVVLLSPQAMMIWWLTFPHWLILYILSTIALHMFPSTKDMASWPVVAVVMILGIWFATWLGLRWPTSSTWMVKLQSLIYPLVVGLGLALAGIVIGLILMKGITALISRYKRVHVQ